MKETISLTKEDIIAAVQSYLAARRRTVTRNGQYQNIPWTVELSTNVTATATREVVEGPADKSES